MASPSSDRSPLLRNPPHGNDVRKGSPPPGQKENLEVKLDRMSNFFLENMPHLGLFFSAMGYGILYLHSDKIERSEHNTRVLNLLYGWTALMMILLFIQPSIRGPARVQRLSHSFLSGVIFASGVLVLTYVAVLFKPPV